MKISISRARELLRETLATSGATDREVELFAEIRLERDLRGNTFSGFENISEVIGQLKKSKSLSTTLTVDKPALRLVDANQKSAILVAFEQIDSLVNMTTQCGIATLGIFNSTYRGSLDIYARAIADKNLIAIVSANGGPQGVVPFGGKQDIFGTNPIAFGIPTLSEPVVFDAATAKYAYGSIRLAKERGETLPAESYFDKEGNLTQDPNKARSIVPFGEHKGYAINLLLEVLTGALVRAKSGLSVKSESDLGSIMIAIDPSSFGPLDIFLKETSKLVEDILNVEPAIGFSSVEVPGYRSSKLRKHHLDSNEIEISDNVWEDFVKTRVSIGLGA